MCTSEKPLVLPERAQNDFLTDHRGATGTAASLTSLVLVTF